MTKTGTRRVTIVALFSIRRFRKRSAAVAAVVAATALLAMSCRHYRNEFAVNALKITVESPRAYYAVGDDVPLRVTIENTGDASLELPSALAYATSSCEAEVPLPAQRASVELILAGDRWTGTHHKPYVWVWRGTTAPRITLAPHEKRVVADATWRAPGKEVVEGGFCVRLFTVTFGTGIGFTNRER